MLFASLSHPEIPKNLGFGIDGIELRLDLFPQIDLDQIKSLLKNTSIPILLTLRKKSHGGKWKLTEKARENLIEKLLAFEPHFFDLEYDSREYFLKNILVKYTKTRFIISYHSFKKSEKDLNKIFNQMQKHKVFGYKIAVLSQSTEKSLERLLFNKDRPNLSVINMGEKGAFTRVLSPIFNHSIQYTALEKKEINAPGQLCMKELNQIYRSHSLNSQTKIYGLIGDPVNLSQGHIYHNAFFEKKKLNAIYVKMNVTANNLPLFLSLAKRLPFSGLSITMPLKEKIFPFVNEMDDKTFQIGAINTILFQNDKIIGTNTDGKAALDAIEKKCLVKNKKIVLLGAGGVAKAIAFEAKWRGAQIIILNRTLSKAKHLAIAVGGKWGHLLDMPKDYDILIQCTPHAMPILPSQILSRALVMDTVYKPKNTFFLKVAAHLGCQLIYGNEMFSNQAAAQLKFWLQDTFN